LVNKGFGNGVNNHLLTVIRTRSAAVNAIRIPITKAAIGERKLEARLPGDNWMLEPRVVEITKTKSANKIATHAINITK
jgi:hypothetical protein